MKDFILRQEERLYFRITEQGIIFQTELQKKFLGLFMSLSSVHFLASSLVAKSRVCNVTRRPVSIVSMILSPRGLSLSSPRSS